MYRRFVWPLVLLLSISLMVVFVGGIMAALAIVSAKPSQAERPAVSEASIPQAGSQRQLVLVGDSLATGIGDETGLNIGERYAQMAEKEGVDWQVADLSVPGARSEDLAGLLTRPAYREALASADLLVVSIGGNNLKAWAQASEIGEVADYERMRQAYLADLDAILAAIKPETQVVFLGLYNPYGEAVGAVRRQWLHDWNYETQQRVETENRVFVPLYDLFKYHRETYLFLDGFHPNSQGYEAIAGRVYGVIGQGGE